MWAAGVCAHLTSPDLTCSVLVAKETKAKKRGARGSGRRGGIPELRDLRSLLPRRGETPRRVVLLADEGIRRRVTDWVTYFTDDEVVIVSPEPAPEWQEGEPPVRVVLAESLQQVNARLRELGAVDVLVNLLPADRLPLECADHRELFVRVVRHLGRGGAFVHDRSREPGVVGPSLGAWLALLDAVEDPARRSELGRLETEVARSVGTLAVTRDLVVVTKRHDHLLMLRDTQVARLLGTREPELVVERIDARPEGEFPSRTTVHQHGEPPADGPMPDLIRHPPLVTRHYRGRVALSGRTLMWTGHTVLPDSFRWHLTEHPGNHLLRSPVGEFTRIDRDLVPRTTLKGDYYQLEAAYPSHFGHVMTESVSRLWGWDEAKRRLPDLKVVFHPRPDQDPGVERALFTAYGIDPDDLVAVSEPVWLESVVSASPMWHNADPHFVHPELSQTWDRLGAGLLEGASDLETAPRVFVSRGDTLGQRVCRNAREVEARFAAHGFLVVYPERHPLPDQVRLFRDARVVAGFGGSAMFNVMHTERLETLIVLNQSSYFPRNEHLFAALKGGESHYFWSASDVEPPEDGVTRAALQSSWEFDVATLGADLDRLLSSL